MPSLSETTPHGRQPVHPLLPGTDAVMVQHHGHAMAANYGSVVGELAVCLKRVGLIDRPELELFELRGRAPWLDQVLGAGIGDAVPTPGRVSTVAENEIWRVAADWAMVLGPHTFLTRWRRLAGHHLVAGTITCVDRSSDYSALLLVGPRARRVLLAAGLSEELPVGGVSTWVVAGVTVLIAHEASDRFSLLLPAEGGAAAREALLEAGEPLELGHVGFEAFERLTAAQRSASRPPLS
ncbi:MAG: hypothetical protein H0U80_06505 [Solirubrobacterales bacterium]|nr:hypothetical protein [Solirubrobacterales bacterium]